MLDIYKAKDYGRYADKAGYMPVNFLTDNDITGGNSGSPVLNGKGELIGLAFDGNIEAMAGDVIFDKLVPDKVHGGPFGLIRRTGFHIALAATRDLRLLRDFVFSRFELLQEDDIFARAYRSR